MPDSKDGDFLEKVKSLIGQEHIEKAVRDFLAYEGARAWMRAGGYMGPAPPKDKVIPIPKQEKKGRRSLIIDPWTLAFGFYHQQVLPRQRRIDAMLLREVAEKNEIAGAIIGNRIEQVGAFAQIARGLKDKGFRIVHKDPDRELTEPEQEKVRKLEEFIWRTGFIHDTDREGFPEFLKMIVRDVMTLDQAAVEIQRNEHGEPIAFWALDAATIFKTLPGEETNETEYGEPIKYVQILPGYAHLVATFSEKDIVFRVMTPTSDVRKRGYGMGWLEQSVNIVTAYLFSFIYNKSYFTQNNLPRGIIVMHGDFDPESMDALERQWMASMMGPENKWRTPIVSDRSDKGKTEFIRFDDRSNKDMEYMRWMFFLITVMCGLAKMDPAEIGFHFSFSGTSTLFGHNEQARIKESKDRGLKGVLSFIANLMTEIVNRIPGFEDYMFKFVNIDPEDEREKASIQQIKVQTYKTINEIRTEEGLEPLEGEIGDMILNPQFMQFKQQQEMMQQAQAGGMPGMPGSEALPEGEGKEGSEGKGLPPNIMEIINRANKEEGEEEEKEEEMGKAFTIEVEF